MSKWQSNINRMSPMMISYYKDLGPVDINLFNPSLEWCGIRGSVFCWGALLNSWSEDLLQVGYKILSCRGEVVCYTVTSAMCFILSSVFQIASSFGIFLFIYHLALEGKRFPTAYSIAWLTISILHLIH